MTQTLDKEIAHLIVEHLNDDQTNALAVGKLIAKRLAGEQTPVAWRVWCGLANRDRWSYAETEAEADSFIKRANVEFFEKQPLYARPIHVETTNETKK